MDGKEPEEHQPRRAVSRPAEPDSDSRTNPGPDDEDHKPLYRDEVPRSRPYGGSGRSSSDLGTGDDVETQLTAAVTGRLGRAPRAGQDPTQMLPRAQRASYTGARSDFDSSDDDDLDGIVDDRRPMGQRTRLALLIAGVAAVAIVGLAIGYAVLNIDDQPRTAPSATSAPVSSAGSTGSPTPDPNALLTDTSMLSAVQAKRVAADRTWKVALTQRGVDPSSPQPACLGADAVQGQPTSQQTVLRLLSSSGNKAPGILQQATAYASPEEAAQAYALAAKAVGGCSMVGAYIVSGWVVNGLGDQAVGEVVNVRKDRLTQFHSVVLSRTGRVVNVVDVARPDSGVAVGGVAQALAAVTNTICTRAAGHCAAATTAKLGPPPLGGDQPGFLASGDLPPVGNPATATWAGTVPGLPGGDFTGSGCETVNWLKVSAQKRAARTYLLQDADPTFGLDDIVLTWKNPVAAQDLVRKVKADLDSCAKRKLTASVSRPGQITGVGANGTPISGWTATVSQKTTQGTARYRVGIASAGTKTVFAFLNPQKNLDFTEPEWNNVTVRAAQRVSQLA